MERSQCKIAVKEGVCRALSQVSIYLLDSRKVLLQTATVSDTKIFSYFTLCGMFLSSLTTGISFTTYFSVYNATDVNNEQCRSFYAAMMSSIVTTPLGNWVRHIQVRNGTQHLNERVRAFTPPSQPKFHHMFRGYSWGVIDQFVDMQMKYFIYSSLISHVDHVSATVISGFLSGFITNPIDTMRTRVSLSIPILTKNTKCKISNLYQGALEKGASSAIKNVIFNILMQKVNL